MRMFGRPLALGASRCVLATFVSHRARGRPR
jgi:hypothetical protein